ncbi:YlcG family protein [Lelliottia sp. V89_10]|nr:MULTISPECIES: YlcG family protein [unclassified Lelliottia]MDI3359759.1 YlcG family protein [Lelliottia sp. V89_13]MDK9548717.1 YlcG family protein [Lelliottia sp. V89_5]MDK9597349.1 YlcG family protein [Lelliottia sp. V89_10]
MTHPIIIFELHRKWRQLRRFHIASSVLVDYRILKNYAARLLKEKKK